MGEGSFILRVSEIEEVYDVGEGLELESWLVSGRDTQYAAAYAAQGAKKKLAHEAFVINFVKGKTYQIDMIRAKDAAMSPYLFLEDAKKKVLAERAGIGKNAQLIFTAPQDGAYRIIATSFTDAGQGDFTLKIAEKK